MRTNRRQELRKTEPGKSGLAMWAIAAALAGTILAVDLLLPLGIAGGVPYMALVLLGWWFERQRNILVLAGISTAFTIIGFFLSPEGSVQWMVVTNRILALAAIWFTAALLFKAKETQFALRATHRTAQESEARYAGIIDIALEAIINADGKGRIRLFNQGAEAIFGYRADEVIGRPIEHLMPGRLREGHRGHFTGFADAPDASRQMGDRAEIMGLRKDGSEFPAEASVSKLTLRSESIFTVVLRDATASKRAEEAIAARTRFFAAASHDLRQPLHAMALHLPNLEEEALGASLGEAVTAIRNGCDTMGALLDSLLDISKLDAGVVTAKIDRIPIADIFEHLATEFAPQAAAKGLELRVAPTSAWGVSDVFLLLRILRNFLVNAIHYTPQEGKVLLGVLRRAGQLRLEVRDTGIGITADHLEHIFEEFYQGETCDSDGDRSLGLGLSIVDRLARLLGHRVGVRSWHGKGSVFSIELPMAAQPAERDMHGTAPASMRDLAGLRIVLVEDDAAVLKATESLLDKWGCTVTAADTVADAVARVAASERVPDLILADLDLGGDETGVEAIEAIRGASGNPVPAIIITACVDPRRLDEAVATGYPIIGKPLAPERLRVALEAVLPTEAGTAGPDTPRDAAPPTVGSGALADWRG